MNKVILMSISSELLVKILNSEKTIVIRRTMPKCELPIDVYLYCTKTNKKGWCMVGINGNETYYQKYDRNAVYSPGHNYSGNGKVVAKLTLMEVYAGDNNLYAYHMENLEILDKPMELREFSTSPYTDWVEYRVRKAPQSWQYAYKGE